MKLSVVAAFSEDLVIGQGGDLPWRIPEDLARFKTYTLGHWLVVGRRTWDSIGRKPLPGRTMIVVSRTLQPCDVPGAHLASSYLDAVSIAQRNGAEQLIACGGERIYAEALPLASEACVTVVRGNLGVGARFPQWAWLGFVMRSNVVKVDSFESNGHRCTWELWRERVPEFEAH